MPMDCIPKLYQYVALKRSDCFEKISKKTYAGFELIFFPL